MRIGLERSGQVIAKQALLEGWEAGQACWHVQDPARRAIRRLKR
jgi:hypothetical protein